MIEQGLSYCEVARELGIRVTLIHNWRKAFEADCTLKAEVDRNSSVEAKLKRLREVNRQLKMERDILISDGLKAPMWNQDIASVVARGVGRQGISCRSSKITYRHVSVTSVLGVSHRRGQN